MSFTKEEVELLKECLKEICDENYFSPLHELKKKLVALTARERELDLKATRCEEQLRILRENHFARPYTIEFRDATSQTEPGEEQPTTSNDTPAQICNLPTTQTHGGTTTADYGTSTASVVDDDADGEYGDATDDGISDIEMNGNGNHEEPDTKPVPNDVGPNMNNIKQRNSPDNIEVITIDDDD